MKRSNVEYEDWLDNMEAGDTVVLHGDEYGLIRASKIHACLNDKRFSWVSKSGGISFTRLNDYPSSARKRWPYRHMRVGEWVHIITDDKVTAAICAHAYAHNKGRGFKFKTRSTDIGLIVERVSVNP